MPTNSIEQGILRNKTSGDTEYEKKTALSVETHGSYRPLTIIRTKTVKEKVLMAKKEVTRLDSYDEITFLMCYRTIIERMEHTDSETAYLMAQGFYAMISGVNYPGIGDSIKGLVGDLLKDAELDRHKLVLLRILVILCAEKNVHFSRRPAFLSCSAF